jgi:hypothetical protein
MALTQQRLKELLRYDCVSGDFIWIGKSSKKTTIGAKAGCLCKTHGYRLVGVDGKVYRANRLAFLYMTGLWPEMYIDHINRNRADDRWENLRKAGHLQNLANSGRPRHNTSGFKGVSLHRETGKWRAAINIAGKKKSLGLYLLKEDAGNAYKAAAIKYYGDFACSV